MPDILTPALDYALLTGSATRDTGDSCFAAPVSSGTDVQVVERYLGIRDRLAGLGVVDRCDNHRILGLCAGNGGNTRQECSE